MPQRRAFLLGMFGILVTWQNKALSQDSLSVRVGENAVQAREFLQESPDDFVWVNEAREDEIKALIEEWGNRVAGMVNDHYLEQQVRLLERIDPRPERVLVPVPTGGASEAAVDRAKGLLEQRGFEMVSAPIGKPPRELAEINKALGTAQAILVIPDANHYYQEQLSFWFKMTLRKGAPMVGAWKSYQVEWGMLAGIVYTDDEIRRVREHAIRVLKMGKRWGNQLHYPGVEIAISETLPEYYGITFRSDLQGEGR